MDLAVMRTQVSKGNAAFVLLVNVYTREAFTRPCKNKEPINVRNALKSLWDNELKDRNIATVFSDAGLEFSGVVRGFFEVQGVVQKSKTDKEDVNQLGVLDRAMGNLKVRLAKSLAAKEGEWADRLALVTRQYNATEHSTVHGEPQEVLGREVQNFLVLQDNAHKLAFNQKLFKRRKGLLHSKGAFRAPKQGLGKFKRGFRAAAYGPVEAFDHVRLSGSIYKTAEGREIDIKRLMPVAENTDEVEPRFALHDSRDEKRRDETRELAEKVYMYLSDGEEKSLSNVAAMLKDIFSAAMYRKLLASGGGIGGGALAFVLKTYWDDAFTLTQAATGKDNYYVKVNGG